MKNTRLGGNKKQNQTLLADAGYVFGDQIFGQALHSQFIRTSAVAERTSYYSTHKRVDTHKHGIQLLHSVDSIKTAIGMPTGKVKTILERLFRKGNSVYKKLLSLETAEFYVFVINNEHLLKQEFRDVTSDMAEQMSMLLPHSISQSRISSSTTPV